MPRKQWPTKVVSSLLIPTMLGGVFPPRPAWAELVPTESVITSTADRDRARLRALVDREDVRAQLQAYGVSADEAGEVQIVEDLINKGVAGIAISPSNAPAMANMLKAKKPKMPIMTIDADLAAADRALRKTYLGTNNYDMGVLMAKHLKQHKPKGGSVCLQLGNVAADNINARAAGFRDTIAGKKGVAALKGEGGWTEIAGCPLFTNDQIDLANQQMADVFTKNPKLDAFILIGGWAQFGPQAYAQVTDQVMPKLKSKELIIIAGDTLPPQLDALKAGRSHAQIGQRPFEMGYRAPTVLIDLINGKKVADPLYTGLDECTPANLGKCPAK